MEFESGTSFNEENSIRYGQESDEEPELEIIKRKRAYPLCIIDSDSNSGDERTGSSKNETKENPEIGAEMGMPNVSDMVQNLLQSRDPGISPLQCSECDLECPSLQALEFHTKLHVMERIVQQSYAMPGIGLKKHSDETIINSNSKTRNKQNSSKEKHDTPVDEARDIETIMKSLVSREDSEEISYVDSGSGYGKRHHKCEECGIRYKSIKNLQKHMRTHTGEEQEENPDEKKYICQVCGNTFKSKTKLNAHMVEHSDKRPYKCKECVSRFKTQDYLEAHMLLHLSSKSLSSTFDGKDDLKLNLEFKHPADQHALNEFGASFENKKIKRRFKAKNKLKKRIDKPSDKRPFKCKECNSRFKTKHYLEAHMLLHGTFKKYSCSFCEYKCSKKALLTRHMLIHTGTKSHACVLCHYRCNDKGNLSKHMMTHGDEKPFSCPEEGCDYKCKFKVNLKPHMLKHTGVKPFACPKCDYRSIDKSGLTAHMYKHSGVKPFPCPVCGNRYAIKRDLNVHMRIHTNDKKFGCQLCEYRCFTKQRLNQHMLKHTGEKPHKCGECGSRFTSTSSLKKHMRTHGIFGSLSGRAALHKCDECGSRFTSASNLKKHMRSHGIYGSQSVGPSQLSNDIPHISEDSNASSQPYQPSYQTNAQAAQSLYNQVNQHIIGASSLMGINAQSLNNHHILGTSSITGRNEQSLNNQHLLGPSGIMGRNYQETSHPDVNYKNFFNNTQYYSL